MRIPMRVFNLFASPKLPSETKRCSRRSAEAATVSVGEITSGNLRESNRGVAVIHHRLREVGGALAVRSGEVTDDISRTVRSFPHVGTRGGGLHVELPAGGVFVEQVRDAAPVHIIGFIAARSFLADVIGRNAPPRLGIESGDGDGCSDGFVVSGITLEGVDRNNERVVP